MQDDKTDIDTAVANAPLLKVTDLPSDILSHINDLVNDSLLYVSPTLLNLILTHQKFFAAAARRLKLHQRYQNAYTYVEISPDAVTTSPNFESAQTLVFESPFMMLVAMHTEERMAYYVRSLTCTGSQDMRKSSSSCSRTLLQILKNDRRDMSRFKAKISHTISGIVARPYVFLVNDWLASLVNGDRGHGIMVLLHQMIHLRALRLRGPLQDWYDMINFCHLHRRDSPVFRSNLRTLEVATRPSVSMKRFCGEAIRFDHLQRLDIHCQVPWKSDMERWMMLPAPQVRVFNYADDARDLGRTIRRNELPQLDKLEYIFTSCRVLVKTKHFIKGCEGTFAIRRFEAPTFQQVGRDSIKMTLLARTSTPMEALVLRDSGTESRVKKTMFLKENIDIDSNTEDSESD